jgi:hypothetical protein
MSEIDEVLVIPLMQSIPKASKATGLSKYFIRQLCERNLVPFLKSGNKFYVNLPVLMQMLNDPVAIEQLSSDQVVCTTAHN